MGLTDELNKAVHAPPPQGFDLDQLIHRGRARRTRSRVLSSLAAAAAVATVTVGGYAVAAGWNTTGKAAGHTLQVGSPGAATTPKPSVPVPDDPIQRNIARFNAELPNLPAALHIPANASFAYNVAPGGGSIEYYLVHWKVGKVDVSISIMASDVGPHDPNACLSGHSSDITCTRTLRPHGQTYVELNKSKKAPQYSSINDFRYSGTEIDVAAIAESKAPIVPLAALLTAAHDAVFTLQP